MRYQKTTGRAERFVIPEIADRSRYTAVGSYTPARLKRIFDAANIGDIEQLCLCCREIMERNWDIQGAMEQRVDAIAGVKWHIEPGGDSPLDQTAAKAFEKELRTAGSLNGLDTFYDLIGHLANAVIMPFSASEIVWGKGGSIAGFSNIESHHFTLKNGFVPQLVCNEYPNGMPEEEAHYRFVFHQFRKKSDPARSGLIRALAWLHCFQNWPLKDLFSFIERFGMPFVIAKVDQNAWDSEREVLHSLIRNFGPNGGGVFTKATELELLNASNTGSDNVYFKALEFTHNAIFTLIVGQLASSGDSSGMSNGTAQTKVRQDILEADARALESTIRAQIAAPWIQFHYPEAAVPNLHFDVEPPEEMTQLASIVSTLSAAGFKADEKELTDRFGLKLRYEPPAAAPAIGNSFAMAATSQGMSTAQAARNAAEPGLPKSTRSPAQPGETAQMLSTATFRELNDALEEWLGPLVDELSDPSDLSDLSDKLGSSSKFEQLLLSDMKRAIR